MPNKMADSLSPFVYWGQKKDHISLKIDLKEATVSRHDNARWSMSLMRLNQKISATLAGAVRLEVVRQLEQQQH